MERRATPRPVLAPRGYVQQLPERWQWLCACCGLWGQARGRQEALIDLDLHLDRDHAGMALMIGPPALADQGAGGQSAART